MEDKYFVKYNDEPEREVTKQEYIRAEQNAGFRSKFGPDEVATGGFSNTNNVSGSTIQGRIEYAKKGKRDVHGNIL